MLETERPWDTERLSRAVEGGLILSDAEGRVALRNELAGTLLGAGPRFEPAWRWLRACLSRGIDRARLVRQGEASLDVSLPDGLGGRSLFVRFIAQRRASWPAGLVLLRERVSLDALQADLRLAAQMRHLHSTFQQAAHDLRAPLNALALNVELLRQDLTALPAEPDGSPHGAHGRVELVAREIARLSRMLQVLLAQSGPPRDQVRVFGLRRLLVEVLALVRPQAQRQGVLTRLDVPSERVAVLGPRDHLKQALLNLLVNALEAMPLGGRLNVALETRDHRAQVRISDTGPGMKPEVLRQAFRMHFTTKPGGSGIGLFTARATVQSLGGQLELDTRVGAGTTALIEVPLAAFDAGREVSCSMS
jgi:signal transduction histidine kinase